MMETRKPTHSVDANFLQVVQHVYLAASRGKDFFSNTNYFNDTLEYAC